MKIHEEEQRSSHSEQPGTALNRGKSLPIGLTWEEERTLLRF